MTIRPQPTPSEYVPRQLADFEERLRRVERRTGATVETGTYLPVVAQQITTIGTGTGIYARVGALTVVFADVSVASTGTPTNPIRLKLPFTPAESRPAGVFRFFDASTDTQYIAQAYSQTDFYGSWVYGLASGVGGINPLGQTSSPFPNTAAVNDQVSVVVCYLT